MPDILPQLILNALIAGSFYALLAVGLTLIYGVMDIESFAHGSLAVLGAYFFWTFHIGLSWPVIPSLLLALICLTVCGLILEYAVFLRIKDVSPLVSLVATIGVGIAIKNVILMIWSAKTRSVTESVSSHLIWDGKIAITNHQLMIMLLSGLLMAGLFLFLKKTRTGKALRAVADSKELSAIMGINVRKVITVTVLISTILAGVAGIMAAYDQNLQPQMASFLNIKAFAAVILGGLGSIPGAIAGSFIIGFAENILIGIPFGDFYFPSSAKDAIAFGVLILALYIRPFGIFGMSREEAVRK